LQYFLNLAEFSSPLYLNNGKLIKVKSITMQALAPLILLPDLSRVVYSLLTCLLTYLPVLNLVG